MCSMPNRSGWGLFWNWKCEESTIELFAPRPTDHVISGLATRQTPVRLKLSSAASTFVAVAQNDSQSPPLLTDPGQVKTGKSCASTLDIYIYMQLPSFDQQSIVRLGYDNL